MRPITVGGFVEGAPIIFMDATHAAGLAKFCHRSGEPEKSTILATPGSGVALIDYDNDGWLDIYLLNGSTVEALQCKEAAPHAMLLHNNHDGTFTDVTDKAGVANERWGFGVAVGDYDNDGWPEMYVSNYGQNRLYHNNHDGTFTDVAEKADVTLGNWSAGPTWGDFDHDGYLDLFVPGYVKYDIKHPPIPCQGGIPRGFCQFRSVEVMCGPRGLPGEPDHLFHNNGDGTHLNVGLNRIDSHSTSFSVTSGVDWNQKLGIGNAFGQAFLIFGFSGPFSYSGWGAGNNDAHYPMGYGKLLAPFGDWKFRGLNEKYSLFLSPMFWSTRMVVAVSRRFSVEVNR